MVHGSAGDPAVPSASAFNNTDIMFVQLMLPHHDQAVSMSDLLLAKRGVHPQVAAPARDIKDAQLAEIDTMDGWFEAMGRRQLEGARISAAWTACWMRMRCSDSTWRILVTGSGFFLKA
jgi:uncharacterized protein (DUF305 family)